MTEPDVSSAVKYDLPAIKRIYFSRTVRKDTRLTVWPIKEGSDFYFEEYLSCQTMKVLFFGNLRKLFFLETHLLCSKISWEITKCQTNFCLIDIYHIKFKVRFMLLSLMFTISISYHYFRLFDIRLQYNVNECIKISTRQKNQAYKYLNSCKYFIKSSYSELSG